MVVRLAAHKIKERAGDMSVFPALFCCLFFCFIQIGSRIFKEAPYNKKDDKADGKGCNDGHGLQAVHGVFGKDQRNGKKHQRYSPEKLDEAVRFLFLIQRMVGVGGSDHS